MSIINDALKKLQNQIDDNGSPNSSLTALAEKNESTANQQEGFRSTMTEEPISTPEKTAQKPEQKPPRAPKESHLEIILMILCLLTGLFLPIFNKQSIVSVAYQEIIQLSKRFQARPAFKLNQTVNAKLSTTDEFPNAMAKASNTAVQLPHVEEKTIPPVETVSASAPSPSVSPSPAKPVRAQGQSRLIINGIMTQGEKNLVLIDGQIYEEGDSVDGVKILKITPKGVNILENGEERFLKVVGV